MPYDQVLKKWKSERSGGMMMPSVRTIAELYLEAVGDRVSIILSYNFDDKLSTIELEQMTATVKQRAFNEVLSECGLGMASECDVKNALSDALERQVQTIVKELRSRRFRDGRFIARGEAADLSWWDVSAA